MSVKCVLVLDKTLPIGVLANTASILGITIGKLMPEIVGHTVTDASGTAHPGITSLPIPILAADKDRLLDIRSKLVDENHKELQYVDFSDIARRSLSYTDYEEKESNTGSADQEYLGLAVYGEAHAVNSLTGSLPLLR